LRSKCDVIVVNLFPNITRPSYLAALKSSMPIRSSIKASPLVAFITLRPIFYLVLLPIYLQPMRCLIFFLYLTTVLRFKLTLLFSFFTLFLILLDLIIHVFFEV
jgi:hypothetical protein